MEKSYVMITGAGGGLGKAFVMECAERGWDLFLTDIDKEHLNEIAKTCTNVYSIDIICRECDLADANARKDFYKYVKDDAPKLKGLINVAGIEYEGAFEDRDINEIRKIISVNIMATVELTHAVLLNRDKGGEFFLVNVCSLAGYYPMPLKAVYAASKRFLLDFSLALREEISMSSGKVLALCPAGLPTKKRVIESIDSQGFMGKLTTKNIGYVVHKTIQLTLRGKAVFIPGAFNRVIKMMGQILPKTIISKYIINRWKKTRAITGES